MQWCQDLITLQAWVHSATLTYIGYCRVRKTNILAIEEIDSLAVAQMSFETRIYIPVGPISRYMHIGQGSVSVSTFDQLLPRLFSDKTPQAAPHTNKTRVKRGLKVGMIEIINKIHLEYLKAFTVLFYKFRSEGRGVWPAFSSMPVNWNPPQLQCLLPQNAPSGALHGWMNRLKSHEIC